jgi:uncharacterized membrane protein (DUF106 family)
MFPTDITGVADKLTSFAILFGFIYLHYSGKLIWGKDCDDTKKERDTYREAMEQINKSNAEKVERLEQRLNDLTRRDN